MWLTIDTSFKTMNMLYYSVIYSYTYQGGLIDKCLELNIQIDRYRNNVHIFEMLLFYGNYLFKVFTSTANVLQCAL